MVPAGTAHARCAGETGCPLHGAIASAPDPNSEPKPEERKRKKEKPALSRWALVPFDVLRPRAPLLDVTAGEGQDPLVRGQPWRWGRARRRSKGAAQRALVCTSMEREVLPKMAPILEENVLPAASCWASRPAEMERHQTEPVPAILTLADMAQSMLDAPAGVSIREAVGDLDEIREAMERLHTYEQLQPSAFKRCHINAQLRQQTWTGEKAS